MIRQTMLFGAAAVAVAALAAGLSHATPPGKNGQIAFQRYELHDAPYAAHIVVANSDGSGERTLTHASRRGIEDGEPDWAPDGSRIAFARCSPAAGCSIYTVRPNGRDLRRLSPRCPSGAPARQCVDDHEPAYSPDGQHIAFRRELRGKHGGPTLMVADAHMRHAHRVGPGWDPVWSPDGKELVFLAKPSATVALFKANADGSDRRRITAGHLASDDQPDWSPDGTRILFLGGRADHGNLFTIHPDGTGLRQLTHYKKRKKVQVGSYSPDGQSIVFATVVGAVNPPRATLDDVFVMTADGTDIRPVTRQRNWDGSPDWGPRR